MPPVPISALMQAVPMALVLIAPDERVEAMNGRAEALFGKWIEGRHYITALRQPMLLDCVETALHRGKPSEATLPTRNAARDTSYRARAEPLDGGAVLLSLEDISHVQDAEQMRRDFVANVSHELRSPLTAVLGFIETLQGPARHDPAAQERFLGLMAAEAQRMNRLIHDLLSLSRVESEERMRPAGRVNILALIASARMSLGKLADDKQVILAVNGPDELPKISGDSDQLLQVFTNLIENAIKYGRSTVTIDLSVWDHDPALRGPSVRIEVRDNGEGIDEVHIPRLTERFYRVDGHRSREMGGTGLGLAIVKHIVNRHRGRLRIDSVIGQGSRFLVILPLGDIPATPPAKP